MVKNVDQLKIPFFIKNREEISREILERVFDHHEMVWYADKVEPQIINSHDLGKYVIERHFKHKCYNIISDKEARQWLLDYGFDVSNLDPPLDIDDIDDGDYIATKHRKALDNFLKRVFS